MDNKNTNPNKALFVIDIQEDYTGSAAKVPFPYKESEKLITAVNELIEKASGENIIIVYVRQEFDGFAGRLMSRLVGHGTAIKGNPGTMLDKRINVVSEYCFTKPLPDAFTNPKLDTFLKDHQVNELYLVGLDAAGCVHYTAKGALKRGYAVSIIEDGVLLLEENQWEKLMDKYKKDGITLIRSNEF